MMYELIACVPVLVTTLVLLRRRRERIQRFLAKPVIDGVSLPSPDDEWAWGIQRGHFDCSDRVWAILGPFTVYDSGAIHVDNMMLGKHTHYAAKVIANAGRLHNQRRLETMQQKALKHWDESVSGNQ